MRRLPFLSATATTLVLLSNCTDRVVLLPPTPLVTTPVSQTIIIPAPLPVATGPEKPLDGWLHPMAYPSLIDGKIAYTSTLNPEALLPNLPTPVDLGTLVKAGQPLRLIALGGGLTAGARNGGLYREGQLTAYPNLVARQMGLTDFASPTFGPGEANGTGFLTYVDPTAPHPRWQQVSNQLAPVQAGDPPVLSAYTGRVDNFGVPGMYGDLFNRIYHPEIPAAPFANGHQWLNFEPLVWRFLPGQENQKIGLLDKIIQTKSYDLFFLEDRADEWMETLRKNDFLDGLRYIYDLNVGQFFYKETATRLLKVGKRGVVFTIPHFRDYAFMQWYTTEELKRKAGAIEITYRGSNFSDKYRNLDPTTQFYMMPTAAVAKLYATLQQGDVVRVSLTDADVMDEVEARTSSPDYYNKVVREMAQKLNLALVDLNAIYRQIHQGDYTTADGLKIDGSPRGNFFSSDGTYPTAIGQAVIANELIKALNSTYQSQIPLINVGEFSRTTGAK